MAMGRGAHDGPVAVQGDGEDGEGRDENVNGGEGGDDTTHGGAQHPALEDVLE
jgi:hypothetical protein